MTTMLYQTDSYIKEFEAKILRIDEATNALILDQTAFYPGGGGQPCDTGWIISEDKPVLINRVKRIEGQVFHFFVPSGIEFSEGQNIKGKIEWQRRWQLMRTHSAMHVLCGVVFRDYGALVTGGEMEPLKGRMDFEFATMSAELVGKIEKSVNLEIGKEREIRVQILSREKAFEIPDLIRTKINLLPPDIQEIRTIEIVGLDLQADGGTHVKNTREIGTVKVTDYKSKGAINKRIYLEIAE